MLAMYIGHMKPPVGWFLLTSLQHIRHLGGASQPFALCPRFPHRRQHSKPSSALQLIALWPCPRHLKHLVGRTSWMMRYRDQSTVTKPHFTIVIASFAFSNTDATLVPSLIVRILRTSSGLAWKPWNCETRQLRSSSGVVASFRCRLLSFSAYRSFFFEGLFDHAFELEYICRDIAIGL